MRTVRMCTTRYAGPTDSRGSRVIAKHLTTGKRAIVPWDHALDSHDNHAAAAAQVLGRAPEFSTSVDGGGYVFGVDPANDQEHALLAPKGGWAAQPARMLNKLKGAR